MSQNVHWHSFSINQKRFQYFQLILPSNNAKWCSPLSNKCRFVTARHVTKIFDFDATKYVIVLGYESYESSSIMAAIAFETLIL